MKTFAHITLLIALIARAPSLYAQSAGPMTLQQCLIEAARNSSRLRTIEQQVTAQRAVVRDASASRLPTLAAGASYAYNTEVSEFELTLPLPIPGLESLKRTIGAHDNYDFALTARAPLFMGGTLQERVRAERASLRASERDFSADSLRLMNDVRRAYFTSLGAEQRMEAARQSASRLNRHLNELQGALKIGSASEEMTIQTEARVRQAEAAVAGTEADVYAARTQLAYLVGKSGEEVAPNDELDQPIANPEEGVDIEARRDVSALSARIEQTRHLSGAARGSFLPALSAQAAYHYAKPGIDQFKNDWMEYGVFGVNLSWMLWDWNSRSAKVAQVQAGQHALEARKQDLMDMLHAKLLSAAGSVRLAREALAKTDERLALERRRFDMVQGRYQIGTSSESEYLDAQDDLTAAELDRANTAVRLRLAEAEWLNAAGR